MPHRLRMPCSHSSEQAWEELCWRPLASSSSEVIGRNAEPSNVSNVSTSTEGQDLIDPLEDARELGEVQRVARAHRLPVVLLEPACLECLLFCLPGRLRRAALLGLRPRFMQVAHR